MDVAVIGGTGDGGLRPDASPGAGRASRRSSARASPSRAPASARRRRARSSAATRRSTARRTRRPPQLRSRGRDGAVRGPGRDLPRDQADGARRSDRRRLPPARSQRRSGVGRGRRPPWHGSAAEQADAILLAGRAAWSPRSTRSPAVRCRPRARRSRATCSSAATTPRRRPSIGIARRRHPGPPLGRLRRCCRWRGSRETLTALLISVNRTYKMKDAGIPDRRP